MRGIILLGFSSALRSSALEVKEEITCFEQGFRGSFIEAWHDFSLAILVFQPYMLAHSKTCIQF